MKLLGNIGFIGGGRMGEALIQGLLKSMRHSLYRLYLSYSIPATHGVFEWIDVQLWKLLGRPRDW